MILLRSRSADRRNLAGHVGQHLGDMPHFDPAAPSRQFAGDVQQAAEIAGHHGIGAGSGDVIEAGVADGRGVDGEEDVDTARPAATPSRFSPPTAQAAPDNPGAPSSRPAKARPGVLSSHPRPVMALVAASNPA